MTTKVEQKWGFGMAPVKHETQNKRVKCVSILLRIIEGEPFSPDDISALSEVKGLFNRIYRQDQWDWFTVFEQLGCPGRVKSKNIADNIYQLRNILMNKTNDDISVILTNFDNWNIKSHLDMFINPRVSLKEPQKIYILSTRERKNILKIGFTKRRLIERVNEINSATGIVIPYGVRAVWCVKDAQKLERKIHEALAQHRIRSDREFFDIDYFVAFKLINQIIHDERIEEL
jgi:hypothetical protein